MPKRGKIVLLESAVRDSLAPVLQTVGASMGGRKPGNDLELRETGSR